MRKIKHKEGDIVGDNMVFIKESEVNTGGHRMAIFKCHCGNEFEWSIKRVRHYEKRNCGCGVIKSVERELLRTETTEYKTWHGMKNRCYNPNDKDYHRYGAKGITVCDEWKNSFDKFLEDVGKKPEDKISLDRIDGTKGYEKSNVRWATYEEQNRNLKSNRKLTYKSITMLRIEWANFIGISDSTFDNYLGRHGNNMENILSEMKFRRPELNYPD